MEFKLHGMSVEMQPAITKWSFEDLGDNPESHRWRAQWAQGDFVGEVAGIELIAYPVIKQTRCGVWIDDLAYREWGKGENCQRRVWRTETTNLRFVHNISNRAWAKPTQEQAIKSLAIRLCRWSRHIASDFRRAKSAINAMEKLRPDFAPFFDTAKEYLAGQK